MSIQTTNFSVAKDETFTNINAQRTSRAGLYELEPDNEQSIATLTVAQSIPDATATTVNFNNELRDPGSNYVPGAAAAYTCPTSGTYQISGFITFAASAVGVRDIAIRLATVKIWGNRVVASAASVLDVGFNTIIEARAGQALDIQTTQTSGGALNVTAGRIEFKPLNFGL